MTDRLPIVLFVDGEIAVEPFAQAFADELACRTHVTAQERGRVAALVTGIEPVGNEEVAPFPNLRVVLTCSIGTDHLDVAALQSRGLSVCHTPTYCTSEVADHALACILAGWRGLWTLGARVRGGHWDSQTLLRRFDAQRLGIIGLGRIGTELAHRAIALGVQVVAHDPYVRAPTGVEPVQLHELLAMSDAISLHLPGTPGEAPLLGAREIQMIKPGAVLVNLARASLIDLDALVAALESGAIACAAWDVWPREPPPGDDQRLRTAGLLVTPHVGWSSPQAQEAYLTEAIGALAQSLIRGEEPAGLVRAGAG